MSKETNFKRIALVAVASLGLGVLTSIAPANAVDASADDVDVTTATGVVNTGACSIAAGGQGGTFVTGSVVQFSLDDTGDYYASLTGPAIVESASLADGTASSATATSTTITDADAATTDIWKIRLTGVGTVTVTISTSSTTAAVDALTITSVASCATSTVSIADSNITIVTQKQTDGNTTNTSDTTNRDGGASWLADYTGVDTNGANVRVSATEEGYIRAYLANSYGDAVSPKAMIASASTGCNVAMEATDNNAEGLTPVAATAVLAAANAAEDVRIAVTAAVPGTAVNCTVSLSWNGITVATKSFTFVGVAASITVSDVTVGVKSGNGYYRVTVKDANGNLVPGAVISNSATEANNVAAAGIVSDSSSNTTSTSSTVGTGYGKSPAITETTIGDSSVAEYQCTTKGGAAKVTVRALASGVTYVTSAPFDVYCGAASVDTWSVSLDKASYSPGEIATLTVSAKDADGHIAQSLLTLGASTSSFGGMTFVTAPTTADLFNSGAGVKTYQLSVGTTEGAFVGTFKITGTTDTAAKTLSYKVASTSTAVSNADVLKAIVSLIASINKQIAALQKALLKR